MKIVWLQRYPSDTPTPIAMSDSDAIVYVAQKRDDYRYNTGRVWVEDVKRQKEEQDGKR